MNSSSQSERDVAAARGLVGDIDTWSRQGRSLSSPAWFPLLVVSVTVLAAIPVALLLDGSSTGYWAVAAPLSAVVTGWFFATRRVQPPAVRGALVFVTGMAMLLGVAVFLVWFAGDAAAFVPWLVIACGFGIFACAWRSMSSGVFAGTAAVSTIVVALGGWESGDIVITLVIGVGAAVAAVFDLVRADPGRAHG